MSEEMERNLRNQEKYLAGLYEGKIEGKEEGKIEGKEEARVEAEQKIKESLTLIVKNLLNKNMTDSEIIEITNISKEELEKIKNKLK